jgi:NAD(P)-dependent dehydrogenase (short-subunit alcohol dehydrogenase family)
MGRLDGKVAIITGGASGIGATTAKLAAKEGCKVVIGDIQIEAGTNLEAEILKAGGKAIFVYLDVTVEENWRTTIETVIERYGKLNVLVNNAGIVIQHSVEATSEEEWDLIMGVNAKGTFFGCKYAIPAMRLAGGGSIVNISSVGGLVGPPVGSAAYSPSKGAVRLLTKVIAVQHANEQIRCNCIFPGSILTPMNQASTNKDILEYRKNRIPLGRLGQPEEIAWGIIYLASDESSFVTGAELPIDGGVTAQ